MNNVTHHHNKEDLPEALLEEAALWQARLREAEREEQQRHEAQQQREAQQHNGAAQALWADFNNWLAKDARHRQAWAEMASLWGALESPVAQLIAEQSASHAASPVVLLPTRRPAPRRAFHRLALAAGLVLAVFVSTGWQQDWITQWQSDHVAAVGEQLPIVLDDNSRITLNTDSALAMDYSAQERRVRLLKGEAWFDVASNDSRPFVVATAAGDVRVSGTQFNVRLLENAAVVSLDEGRVELQVPNKQDAVALAPGQQAVLSGDRIGTPGPFDRTAVTAWLRGQFVFYDTPLSEVVATLNRHRHGRIVITSKALNKLKVSGIFATGDPDAALELITNTLPIRQTRLTDYLVLIR